MVENEVLLFGDFTLKSGRKAPYFINAGKYRTGSQIAALGEYYAECFLEHGVDAKTLIGPAYKGIPLAVATAVALAKNHGVDVGFCFDRKEVKDHGDTGILLGSELHDGDKVVMIEDVTTSGKSIEETYPILKAQADVYIKGLMVSLNRNEHGKSADTTALEEVSKLYGFPTAAIVSMPEVMEYLYNREVAGKVVIDDKIMDALKSYYDEYGVK